MCKECEKSIAAASVFLWSLALCLNCFEFNVVLLLDWLTVKVREPSLSCYLSHNWREKRWIYAFFSLRVVVWKWMQQPQPGFELGIPVSPFVPIAIVLYAQLLIISWLPVVFYINIFQLTGLPFLFFHSSNQLDFILRCSWLFYHWNFSLVFKMIT